MTCVDFRMEGGMTTGEDGDAFVDRINLDASAITNFAAGEAGNEIVSLMHRIVGSRQLVATRTALKEALAQVSIYGGPAERGRFVQLWRQVGRIPIHPSARFCIPPSRRLSAHDLAIFGTADRLGIPTLTTDATFVQTFYNRFSILLDAVVVPPLRLQRK